MGVSPNPAASGPLPSLPWLFSVMVGRGGQNHLLRVCGIAQQQAPPSPRPGPLVQTALGFLWSPKASETKVATYPQPSAPGAPSPKIGSSPRCLPTICLSYHKQNNLSSQDGGPICNSGRRTEFLSSFCLCLSPSPTPGSAGVAVIHPGRPRSSETGSWAEALEVRVAGVPVT